MSAARYDSIGRHYATTRREDPQLLDRIVSALGPARTVANGGAGTGSILTSRDTPDWTLGSFWAHPERVLDVGMRLLVARP